MSLNAQRSKLRHQHQLIRRLTLFYVFNDIVQYAARSQLNDYLEFGSSIFLPEVGLFIERLSVKEKNPFIRTLSIWEERHVFSSSFISRVRAHWERQVAESVSPGSGLTPKPSNTRADFPNRSCSTRTLLHGDPKLVDPVEIARRLAAQIRISSRIVESLDTCSSETEKELIAVSLETPRIDSCDKIQALRSALSVELMV